MENIKNCWYLHGSEDAYLNKFYGTWVAGPTDDNVVYGENDFGWHQMIGGNVYLQTSDDAPTTAVLAWEAPKDDTYSIEVSLSAYSAENANGMTVSFYADKNKIASEQIGDTFNTAYQMDVPLKQGERFYLFIDPNETVSDDKVDEVNVFIKKGS